MNEDKKLTGYASIDKPWLKYYKEGAEELVYNIPQNKTIWDVIEEKLEEYYDIPAIEFFKKQISREEFKDRVYIWARAFRAMGVDNKEIVPIYGPFVPDVCAMCLGLNMIGAIPYFLKLAISPKSLEEETRDSKIAVVYDGMWKYVANEFIKDKYKNVVIATVTEDMPKFKKEIVSFLNYMNAKKNKSLIPNDDKYIWLDKAKKMADYYTGNVKVPFEKNRSAFITSSSGTTVNGAVKGIVATNETALAQINMAKVSGAQFYPGDRCLNHFPPAAATSLNVLFLVPLYNGETIVLDPRVSEKDFYNQLINLKPNAACSTGSGWEVFFNRVQKEMSEGKKFDFSYAKGWTLGGEGTEIRKYQKWNEIMQRAHAQNNIFLGYGLSEIFSSATASLNNVYPKYSKGIMDCGIPYAGTVMAVFDGNGKEMKYNQRGFLKIKSPAMMKEYYNKPELTLLTKQNGWIDTGDLAEIDENGFIFVYGRNTNSIKLQNGDLVYLFDIANKIKANEFIDDAVVLKMPTINNDNNLVAHIVWSKNVSIEDKQFYIEILNKQMDELLPNEVELSAYAEHDVMLPYSPTTLKKDMNKMSKQSSGYVQVIDGNMYNIEFILNENGKYLKNCAIIVKDRVKSLTRK